MKTDTKARIWALAGTVAIAALAILLFLTVKFSKAPAEPQQEVMGSIALAEDFIEVIDQTPMPNMANDLPAAAQADQQAQAQPTAPSGTDPANAGDPGSPPPTVAADKPSPHKTDARPQKTGPTKQEQQQQQDQRQAQAEVANAFGNAPGQHNTSSGTADQANSGSPSASTAQGTYTGQGQGTVGGGWGLPSYAPVKSTVTGTVKLKVTIDADGHPTKVEIIGGTPGASTNSAVRQACVAEVKRRTFTRTASTPAPESAIAVITYSFK